MSAPPAAPARTEEMAVVHRVFRHGLSMVAELVRRTPPGATQRPGPIATHVEFLLNGVHHHRNDTEERS